MDSSSSENEATNSGQSDANTSSAIPDPNAYIQDANDYIQSVSSSVPDSSSYIQSATDFVSSIIPDNIMQDGLSAMGAASALQTVSSYIPDSSSYIQSASDYMQSLTSSVPDPTSYTPDTSSLQNEIAAIQAASSLQALTSSMPNTDYVSSGLESLYSQSPFAQQDEIPIASEASLEEAGGYPVAGAYVVPTADAVDELDPIKVFTATNTEFLRNTINTTLENSMEVFGGTRKHINLDTADSNILNQSPETAIYSSTKSSYELGNTFRLQCGEDVTYGNINYSTYDVATNSAAIVNVLSGGMDPDSYNKMKDADNKNIDDLKNACADLASKIGTSLKDAQKTKDEMVKADLTQFWQDIQTYGGTLIDIVNEKASKFNDSAYKNKNPNPVATLALSGDGLSSFAYTTPNEPATSPYASITMRPGTGTSGYSTNDYIASSDKIPFISLTSSQNALNSSDKLGLSYIDILPQRVTISSKDGPSPSPEAYIELQNVDGGSIKMSNNYNQTQNTGNLSITKDSTTIDRTDGTITFSAATGNSKPSTLNIKSEEVALVCGATPDSEIKLNSSGVTIGNGDFQVAYTSKSTTIGKGAKSIVLGADSVKIGDALVVKF